VLVETLVGAVGALCVLGFVFGSFLALVPLLIAAVAILTTFLAVLGLTGLVEVSFIVQFLVALIGLGVAIDYSLLVVTRWREELQRGHDREQAVHRAMATAGRAVVTSGGTVAVGLLALVLLPVPFLRSIGLAGLLIPLAATLATLTLLPVLLATVGPRLDRDGHRPGPGPGRPPGHLRRPDPVPVVRLHGRHPRAGRQDHGHRAGRRHPDRRHHPARAPGPGPGRPPRPLELVAAPLGGPHPAGPAVAARPRAPRAAVAWGSGGMGPCHS